MTATVARLVTLARLPRRRIALSLQGHALLEPRFVLGMKGRAPPDLGEDARESFLIVDA